MPRKIDLLSVFSTLKFPEVTSFTYTYCDTQADADLRYTPQHKPLFIQLPNMKTIKLTVSYSSVVFKTVTEICRALSEFLCPSDLRWGAVHLWI